MLFEPFVHGDRQTLNFGSHRGVHIAIEPFAGQPEADRLEAAQGLIVQCIPGVPKFVVVYARVQKASQLASVVS